jgi:hypothetical protein
MRRFKSYDTLQSTIRRRGANAIPDAFKCYGIEWTMRYYDMAGQVIWYENKYDASELGIWTQDRYKSTKDAEIVTA